MKRKDHRGFWICELCDYPVPYDELPAGQGPREHPSCRRLVDRNKRSSRAFFKKMKARR